MIYNVRFTETISKTVPIEANSHDEAYEKALADYNAERIVIDSGDYTNKVNIKVLKPPQENRKQKETA